MAGDFHRTVCLLEGQFFVRLLQMLLSKLQNTAAETAMKDRREREGKNRPTFKKKMLPNHQPCSVCLLAKPADERETPSTHTLHLGSTGVIKYLAVNTHPAPSNWLVGPAGCSAFLPRSSDLTVAPRYWVRFPQMATQPHVAAACMSSFT